MRKLGRSFDLRFFISAALFVPWRFVKNVTDSFEKIYESKDVDIVPRPLLGETKLLESLKNFLNARINSMLEYGALKLEFIVYKNGEISNVRVTGNDVKTDVKIMKLLKEFPMKWIPGIYKTEVVNVKMKLEVVLN